MRYKSKNTNNLVYWRNSTFSLINLLLLFSNFTSYSQVTVNSLSELLPYLNDDSVDVTLSPGTYSITATDIDSGYFSNPLLLFSGSHSTYDFTDVTIEIATDVLRSFGNVDVNELQILGNYNSIKNLKIVDIGDTHPIKRAQSIVMDGSNNRIEGVHLTVRGSYPYGYGDAFGKGGPTVIKHYKHSAILVRGESNHVKNCTVIHRAYGHAIFTQAAKNAIIEKCYVEGEMRSTDDMLTEEGTGTAADEKDFMTIWGYKLPAGYMMSLQEGGIRAYNAGTTFVNGDTIKRGTENIQVIDCTIKRMRTGVTLAHAVGIKAVSGCKVIECESGYSIGSGTITNCSADAKYGPVLSFAYSSDKNCNADITVLPTDSSYNGAGKVAYIGGSYHNITLRSSETGVDTNLVIQVGGDKKSIRLLHENLPHQNNLTAKYCKIQNHTNYPLVLDTVSSLNSGTSKGKITDFGIYNLFTPTGIYVNLIEKEGINIFPNPVVDLLTIAKAANAQIEIYNNNGKIVGKRFIDNDLLTFQMKGFQTGIYFLRVIEKKGSVKNFKVIKK